MSNKTHLFHFVVSKSMNEKIIDFLLQEFQIKTFSNLFETIFNLIKKKLPKIKKIIGNHRSEYALIDDIDDLRIDKYLRICEDDYLRLKKWYYFFNEYGMASMIRDIILFFYNGIMKYGMKNFIGYIGKELNIGKIKEIFWKKMTHLLKISNQKRLLFLVVIENLPDYAQ